jgi:hypothetical protein
MRVKEPDILLLPFLLPLFILGSIPLLLLVFLGYFGLGLAGLLMLLAAQRDEFDAHGTFINQAITGGALKSTERAIYRTDMQASMRLAFVLRVTGLVAIVCGAAGLYLKS